MKQQLSAGGYLDLLTKDEITESMGHNFDAAIRDLLRGVDYLMFTGVGNGTGLFTIPYSPEQGYCWSIKLLSVQLSASSNVSAYLGSTNTVAPIGNGNGFTNTNNEAIMTWSANQVVLKDSRQITLFASLANITNYLLAVKQVPTEMQGKL